MNILNFPKYFFCDPSFYVTVQKFRMLGYMVLLHATVLGIMLKGLVSSCFHVHFISEY